jgi:hypothetical protein
MCYQPGAKDFRVSATCHATTSVGLGGCGRLGLSNWRAFKLVDLGHPLDARGTTHPQEGRVITRQSECLAFLPGGILPSRQLG